MTTEQVLLQNGNVIISTTRIVTGNATFPTANITSVKRLIRKPKMGWPILMILVGLGLIPGESLVLGITLFLIGLILLFRKATHHLVFSTAGSEVSAFWSKDTVWISELEEAINRAIVTRG